MVFTVKNGDVSLYCEKIGEGENLLLIHGSICDSSYFDGTKEYLKKNFTVITYDRRGYTRSPYVLGGDYSMGAQASDAAAVIEACGGSALVVGCSAGGVIALELARKYPKLVKKLFLHEPPIAVTDGHREEFFAWGKKLREYADAKKLAKALSCFVSAIGGADPRGVKRSIEEQKRDLDTLPALLYGELDDIIGYLPDETKKIALEMPCAVAMGENDTEGLFHQTAPTIAAMLDAELLHVPGYHNFAHDLPYDFAAAVTGVMSI